VQVVPVPTTSIAPRTVTAEERSFLDAIHANPLDLDVRRVYGDWLKERDDPLGEFIHLEILIWEKGAAAAPRGTKTRLKALLRLHGASWRGFPTNRRRRLESGAFFSGFMLGLPKTELFVSTTNAPKSKLDVAFARRLPHHQIAISLDIGPDAPEDLRPVFRHPAFGVAYAATISGYHEEWHARQVMECLAARPYLVLLFRGLVGGPLFEEIRALARSMRARVAFCL
jgi:uncharacterized protein (TIGR02996 family)